jgi:hypothetical protein
LFSAQHALGLGEAQEVHVGAGRLLRRIVARARAKGTVCGALMMTSFFTYCG